MIQDRLFDLLSIHNERTKRFFEIGDITFNSLIPLLPPALLWEPSGIGSEVDELLVNGLVHSRSNPSVSSYIIHSKSSNFKTTNASLAC